MKQKSGKNCFKCENLLCICYRFKLYYSSWSGSWLSRDDFKLFCYFDCTVKVSLGIVTRDRHCVVLLGKVVCAELSQKGSGINNSLVNSQTMTIWCNKASTGWVGSWSQSTTWQKCWYPSNVWESRNLVRIDSGQLGYSAWFRKGAYRINPPQYKLTTKHLKREWSVGIGKMNNFYFYSKVLLHLEWSVLHDPFHLLF